MVEWLSAKKVDKEYAPIADSAQFCNLSISLAQGEHSE